MSQGLQSRDSVRDCPRHTSRAHFRSGVAIRLNSADFQRDGFDTGDVRVVIDRLDSLGVDLVEFSGGSHEGPARSGRLADGRTSSLPLMLTGGIPRLGVCWISMGLSGKRSPTTRAEPSH